MYHLSFSLVLTPHPSLHLPHSPSFSFPRYCLVPFHTLFLFPFFIHTYPLFSPPSLPPFYPLSSLSPFLLILFRLTLSLSPTPSFISLSPFRSFLPPMSLILSSVLPSFSVLPTHPLSLSFPISPSLSNSLSLYFMCVCVCVPAPPLPLSLSFHLPIYLSPFPSSLLTPPSHLLPPPCPTLPPIHLSLSLPLCHEQFLVNRQKFHRHASANRGDTDGHIPA